MPNPALEHRFKHHAPPNEDVIAAHATVRSVLLNAAMCVCELVPDGREQSTLVTKLEEAMFWANAGIAREPETSAARYRTFQAMK